MAQFLAPFWEFLFDAFGVFGIVIALGISSVVIIILIVLIGAVMALLKKIIMPSRKTQRRTTAASTTTQYSTRTYPTEIPRSNSSANETSGYKSPSLEDYLERAQNGEVFAQCCCGSMYENGGSDIKDINKAIYWFEKAADQGHILSNYRLGMIYFEGREVEVDFEKAEEYLTYAAEGENDTAQYQLARLYLKKNEILCEEKGYTTAEQKTADAEYIENKDKYKYWLKKAAANGNLDAEYILY